MNKRIISILGCNFYCVAEYTERDSIQGGRNISGEFKIYCMDGRKRGKMILSNAFDCRLNVFTSDEIIDILINSYGYTAMIEYVMGESS